MKPPYQPAMKNKIFMSATWEKEVLPRRFNRIVQREGLFGLLLVSIAGGWRYKALEIVDALVYGVPGG